jgi:hypothetical protein
MMRPSFSDLERIALLRCEQDDEHAVGRNGESVTGGKKVRLSHGVRFKKADSGARLVVTCDLMPPPKAGKGR